MISHLFKAIFALLFITTSASAQVITRSELAPYILRKDAMEDTRTVGDNYVPFAPMAVGSALGEITREQVVTMPQSWVDAQILLHLESVASAYTLSVNGHQVALCEDQSTPTTYNITRYMRVGENTLSVTSHASSLAFLEEGVAAPNRNIFEGSYL